MLQRAKLDTLPNGRQLTFGEYKDSSRPLRRLLKQLGSGSLDVGMTAALNREDAQQSISQLLGVSAQVGYEIFLPPVASLLGRSTQASVPPRLAQCILKRYNAGT